jgi:hypothetical protein
VAPQPGAATPEQGAPSATETPTAPETNLADVRSGAGRGETFALAGPQMMGDFGGICARRTILVAVMQTITTTPVTGGVGGGMTGGSIGGAGGGIGGAGGGIGGGTITGGVPGTITGGVPGTITGGVPGTITGGVPGTITGGAPGTITGGVPFAGLTSAASPSPAASTAASAAATTVNRTVMTPVTVCDPVAARAGSGFKIADNESPCPQDRVFFSYNYFDRLSGAGGFTPGSTVITNTPTVITSVVTPDAVVTARNANVNRELFGFEKTFLGGNASIEVRVPIFQTSGDDTLNGEDFGDVTTVIKFALLQDPDCSHCLSLGLAVTAPTGPSIATVDGTIHDVLLQPFVGGLWTSGNWFFQGFSSLVVPTDSRDVTLLFNDVALGYAFYHGGRDCWIRSVAPEVEVHVTTPLNHRDANAVISVPDIVDVEPGVYIGLGEKLLLSIGVAVPVTGPKPFDVEAIAQVNFRF